MPNVTSPVESAQPGPSAESILKSPIDSISEPATNMLLGLCDPTHSVRLVRRRSEKLRTRVQEEKGENGGKTIALPDGDLTTEELLRAALLLNPNLRENKNPPSPMRQFTGNLRDGAILLAKEMKRRNIIEADDVVGYLYNFGSRIDAEIEGVGNKFVPKTPAEIQAMQITYPDSITTNEQKAAYNREVELYLFFGKNIILPPREEDHPDNAVAEHTAYELLYKKWRDKQQATAATQSTTMGQLASGGAGGFTDSWELRQRFEREYLDEALKALHRYPRITLDLIRKGLEGGRPGFALESLVQTGAFEQLFIGATTGIGEKHLTETLPVSQYLRKNLLFTFSEDEVNAFLQQYNLDKEGVAENLFQTAAKVVEDMKRKGKTVYEQMDKLFELVNAFPSSGRKGNGINEYAQAAAAQEFDCTMKSLLLGRLLQQHLGDSLYIFGVTRIRHVELLVMERNTEDPSIYGINANTTYLSRAQYDAEMAKRKEKKGVTKVLPTDLPIGLDDIPERSFDGRSESFTSIQKIKDPEDRIYQLLMNPDTTRLYDASNPQFYHIPIVQDGSRTSLTIGPWERIVQGDIIQNLSIQLPDYELEDKSALNYLANLAVPRTGKLLSLGNALSDLDEDSARLYLERAQELFPDYYSIWIARAKLETNPEKQIEFLRQAVSLDTFKYESWTDLGEAYINNRQTIENAIDLARRCLRKAVTLNPTGLYEWYNIGATYLNMYNAPPKNIDEFDEAIAGFTKFLEFPPEDSEWYRDRASTAKKRLAELGQLKAQFLQQQ